MMRPLRRAAYAVLGSVRQVRALLLKRKVERELTEELAHHVAMETEQNIARGMDPAEARRAALVAFGGVDRYAEKVRDARWTRWLEDLARDVKYALRSLGRSRAFTGAAILTLALGIGANAALYGLIDGLVLQMPTGVPETDRLAWVQNDGRNWDFAHADLRDLQHAGRGAIHLAGYQRTAVAMRAHEEPVRVWAELVTGNYFDVLGMQPERGRWFTAEEDEVPARDAVAVISHTLWQTQFAGDADVVGRIVALNGHSFTVIGVARPGFRGLSVENRSDLWVPFMTQPWIMPRDYDLLGSRTHVSVSTVGRLAPGIESRQAAAALGVAAGQLPVADRNEAVIPHLIPMRGWIPAGALSEEGAIFGFAGLVTIFVLLICCANVAGLQLARSLGRGREIAVRMALGAGRGRLIRFLVTESVLLATAAGALGTLLAWWLLRWLVVRFGDMGEGPFGALDVTPHGGTILVTFVFALIAGLTFGLMPALRTVRPGLMLTMKGEPLGASGGRRMRGWLSGMQVALSLVLLMATGLFINRARELGDVDVGFDAEHLAAFAVDLPANGYDDAARDPFFNEVRRRLRTVPGVQSVAGPTFVPLGSGTMRTGVTPEEGAGSQPSSSAGASPPGGRMASARVPVVVVGVDGEFFSTLEVRAMSGRTLAAEDLRAAEKNVVVSAQLAQRLWPTASPVGRRIVLGTERSVTAAGDTVAVPAFATVVGTVDPIPISMLAEPDPMQVYVPQNRHVQWSTQSVLLRFSGDADAVLPRVRDEMRRLDDALPLIGLRVLARDIDEQVGAQRALTRLVGGFGVLALLLAVIGLYGMVASAIAGRTREIGVRIALGARAGDVTRMFVGSGVRVACCGIAVGMLLALPTGRLISSVIWGVSAFDPRVLMVTSLTLVAAAAAASWIPARRAAKIDPMETLRQE